MARINIYISDVLEACMRFRKDINWSQVAQEAFREAVERPKRDILKIASKPKKAKR